MRTVGTVILLVMSLALGVILGELNFRFILRNIPPMALAQSAVADLHFKNIALGLGAGLLFYLWSVITIAIARAFPRKKKLPAAKEPSPSGRSDPATSR